MSQAPTGNAHEPTTCQALSQHRDRLQTRFLLVAEGERVMCWALCARLRIRATLRLPKAKTLPKSHHLPKWMDAPTGSGFLQARHELAEHTGVAPLAPEGWAWFSQMASLPLPACDTAALSTHLRERHRIEIPVFQWNGHTMVRLSVQAYNTQEDVETLVQAVKAFLA